MCTESLWMIWWSWMILPYTMFTNTGTSIRIRFSAVRLEVSTLLPTETCFWRTLSFWLISMLYIACCKIYTWLFLANVREVQWVSVVKFARGSWLWQLFTYLGHLPVFYLWQKRSQKPYWSLLYVFWVAIRDIWSISGETPDLVDTWADWKLDVLGLLW